MSSSSSSSSYVATFQSVVTLDPRFCHSTCYRAQLNRFALNGTSTAPSDYYKNLQGDSTSRNGVCGKHRNWGYCTVSIENESPPAPTNFPQAADDVDWKSIVEGAVEQALSIAQNQRFEDGNHRTALIAMFERISMAGLHITADVDIFRLYVNLKYLTDNIGSFGGPPVEGETEQEKRERKEREVKSSMIKLLKDVVRIRATAGSTTPVSYHDRIWLANTAKTEVPAQLREVSLYKAALDAAVAAATGLDNKRTAIRVMNRTAKADKPQMFARFKFMYPKYSSL
ncbi:hypothetical protein DL96DRAFT_1613585 [Flagelloscypha sp. PMI_526]|nr:hypothetical protein DL96DRAFT_1613585 [Flagelloscypha sp. PMI_526]